MQVIRIQSMCKSAVQWSFHASDDLIVVMMESPHPQTSVTMWPTRCALIGHFVYHPVVQVSSVRVQARCSTFTFR